MLLLAPETDDGGLEQAVVSAQSDDAGAPASPRATVAFTPDDGGDPYYATVPLPRDERVIDYYLDAGARKPLEPAWLHITGNRVLPEEIYREVLVLPEGAKPDRETAAYIEEALYNFLQKGGYDLASVATVVNDNGVEVTIDEGELEKIVFTGRLTFQQLRFRLELFIDQGVFNRPALERQVAVLAEKIGVPVVRWSLVPTPHPDHMGPQLETLGGAIDRLDMLHARKQYELWFYFEETDWNTGVGLDLRSGYIDGLELGLNYQGVGRFDDRWRVAASGGVGLRFRISDNQLYPAFSRALLEARWYSKELGPSRLGLWFTSNLYARQRRDLDVEDYHDARAAAGIDYGTKLGAGITITPAVGIEWQKVFDIEPTTLNPDFSKIPEGSERVLAFADLEAEWMIGRRNPRWDRQHKLELGARYYFGRSLDTTALSPNNGISSYGWFTERYQQVLEFGWHDLWLKSRARYAFGDVQFQDEENLGELLRGVFGTFERRAGNIELEFRFSLSRDILKVSFFTQFAAWGEIDRPTNNEALRLGIAAGPGFHALILGMFQMDLYASVGFRSRTAFYGDSPFAFGLVALLNKTY